jgi:uncharacterized protein (TIGR03437 family)
MERVECNVTLRTSARQITVYPLDGAGGRRAALPASEVETTDGGFRLRLQTSEGNAAFWYEIVTDAEAGAAHVSAANYRGERLARDSIVAAFGAGLATRTEAATNTPLPTMLGGTRVSFKDSAGRERDAGLFFVSPGQVNYLLPADGAVGTATITITSGDGARSLRTAQITSIAPGLFTANGNGQGVPAAVALRVRADGTQSYEPVAVFDAAQNRFVARALDLGGPGEQVYLLLFGTGLRNRGRLEDVRAWLGNVEAPVSFTGAQGALAGLDQINVQVPRALIRRGEVELQLSVNGKLANAVQLNFK